MTETMQQPADMLARLGRHWGWLLVYGILTLLAGIVVIAWPGITLVTLAVILGIWLIIFGVMEIVGAFRVRSVGHAARRAL